MGARADADPIGGLRLTLRGVTRRLATWSPRQSRVGPDPPPLGGWGWWAVGRALPDVVVMDVRLPDGSGIEATRAVRAAWPATRVLMVTSCADDEALYASVLAGAAG